MSSDQPPKTPIDLEKKRAEKTSEKAKDKHGIQTIEKIDLVYLAMIGRHVMAGMPEFPEKFYALTDATGKCRFIAEEAEGICRYVAPDFIKDAIQRYILKTVPTSRVLTKHQIWLAGKDVDEVFKKWRATSPIIDEPAPFLQRSESGRTFKRLDFDFNLDGKLEDCPTFAGVLARIPENMRRPFVAFIGSIFVADSDLQQHCFIFGDGNDGKGAVVRALHGVLGHAASAQTVPEGGAGRRFWTSGLLGKRLVSYGDLEQWEAENWPSSGFFKSLTGGDDIRIEMKGGAIFSARLNCKHLIASNWPAKVSAQIADQRRLIYVRIEPLGQTLADVRARVTSDFEANLAAEMPSFIGYALRVYHEMCPTKGPIPVDYEVGKQLAEDGAEEFQAVFDAYFLRDENGSVPAHDVQAVVRRAFGHDNRKLGQFKRWLETNGINTAARGKNPDRSKEYRGMILGAAGINVRHVAFGQTGNGR